MANNIYSTIIDLLEKRGPIPGKDDQERLAYNYLDAGHVDSINMIQFTLEIEELFGVVLTPEDTISEQFRSVRGLVQIVEDKLRADR